MIANNPDGFGLIVFVVCMLISLALRKRRRAAITLRFVAVFGLGLSVGSTWTVGLILGFVR
jgi:hypothetical protein